MKHLLIFLKIVKNPQRAFFALHRRMRAVFICWYVWIYYQCGFIIDESNVKQLWLFPHILIIPDSFTTYDQSIIDCAYKSLDVYGDFLGVRINDAVPPWHEDVRLRATNNPQRFFLNAWYSTIKIHVHTGSDLGPDVKIPWMVGRLNHVSLWAYAFHHTKDQQFLDASVKHLEDFLRRNPPFFGVQWMCTMEVALRAINVILTFSFLNKHLFEALREQLISSLYYHWWYIGNHWEWYDGKTNNHYLSNLVGYWWLCSFFKNMNTMHQEAEWCVQQLIKEVEKQQLPDGAFYEGSTAYHRLSTDLVSIALAIDADDLLYSLKEKYALMEKVDSSFEYDENQRIFIGDNDSSPVLHPELLRLLRPKQLDQWGNFSLQHFGLDSYKNDSLHVTVRQHVYTPQQPTGHFHDDCNAITLAINKTACIVDPGTYVYTASLPWRNKLRDVSAHGTCYMQREKNWENCFANTVSVQKYHGTHHSSNGFSHITATCSCRGFKHERSVVIDSVQKKIIMTDFVYGFSERVIWQLTIRGIVVRTTDYLIEFNTEGVIWQLHMQQKWRIDKTTNAPSYGILEPLILVSMYLENNQNIETIIRWN